jgi:two-component system LytT family response regulator
MKKLQVTTQNGFQFINPLTILFLKASNNYTEIFYTDNSDTQLICKTIGKIEKCLPSELFFRCHRTYIINIKQITEFKYLNCGGIITLKNNQKIKLAKRKKKMFLEIIKKNTFSPLTQ